MKSSASNSLFAHRIGPLYLRARWFWGVGLLLVPLVIRFTTGEFGRTWLIAVAGAVTLVHSVGLALWRIEPVVQALFVDLLVTHTALLIQSKGWTEYSPVVLNMVGFSLLIMLFAQGTARWVALATNAAYTLTTIGIAYGWGMDTMIGPILGIGFITAMIVTVIGAFNNQLSDLEMARAVTLGIASHELRNRLTGVIGVTGLLAEDDLDGDEAGELLLMAHREALEAGAVIEDLLIVSRAERGINETSPSRTDLSELVRNVVGTFEQMGLPVKVEGADRPIWVHADPVRAPQVIRNLLANAQRYGGPDVRVVVAPGKEAVSLLVSDDGPGVHRDDLPALFTPYHRTKRGEPKPGSTGLGLWISRNLMRSMGGDLTYRRVQDRTVFDAVFRPASAPQES